MKKFILNSAILVSIIFYQISFAQYSPTSLYLQNPELAIGYTDSCAQFWLQTWDNQRGGFYTNIDKYGNVLTVGEQIKICLRKPEIHMEWFVHIC